MSIYPDKKDGVLTGRWRVEVQLKGLRKRGRFNTHAEAKEAERKWSAELAAGDTAGATLRSDQTVPQRLSHLVAKAAPLLWNGSEHGELSEGKVKTLIGWVGDPLLTKLGTFVDDAIIRLREEGRSAGTINRYLSAL